MIRFATGVESEQIVNLWQEAFGDSRSWVLLYLGENIDNVLIYEEDGVVMGMLSLLPVSYKGKNGYYVYGVATGKLYRSKGISTKLLTYAKALVEKKDVDFLVLVPRNEGLFNFYGERGFFPMACVETQEFCREELMSLECGSEVTNATQKEYYDIRRAHFENLIEWDSDMLSSIKRFENGEYYKDNSGNGAFCYAYDGKLYVKELCGSMAVLAEIVEKYDCEAVLVTRKSDSQKPSCMVYPEFFEDVFFNISID